jgi:HK97 family phage portal protein
VAGILQNTIGAIGKLFQRSVQTKEVQALYNPTILSSAISLYSEQIRTEATPETAIQVPSVVACINSIAGTLSTAPIELYRKEGKQNVLADDTILYDKLSLEPNEDISTSDLIHAFIQSYLLRGFWFCDIVYNNYGTPFLYPLDVWRHLTYQEGGVISYELYLTSGKVLRRYEPEVLHIRNFTKDGITAVDPIRMLKPTLMLALQLLSHGVNWFKNYNASSGVLSFPEALGEDARANLKRSLEELHSGVSNAGKTIIVEQGGKFDKTTDTLLDSQYEQIMTAVDKSIARFFKVQPHKIGILDKSSFNNIESENSSYLRETILPIIVKFERECKRKLLIPNPAYGKNYFYKFDLDAINRAEMLATYQAYQLAVVNGIMSRNEVREKLGLSPYVGGDEFLTPLNMRPGNADANQPPTPPKPPEEKP